MTCCIPLYHGRHRPESRSAVRDEQTEIQQQGWQGESRSPQLRTQQGPVLYQTIEAMKEAEDDINIQDIKFLGCAPLRPVIRDNQNDSRRERTAPLKSVFSATA